MADSTIKQLGEWGQSIWFDNIGRSLLDTGKLQELIEQGLRGMTSNPTIFDKAISSSSDYDKMIVELHGTGKSTFEIYDDVTIKDVQDAADILRPVYDATDGLDGYISLEIDPNLASDTAATIKEGKRLHEKVNRQNLMLKVPFTDAAAEAVEELLASGMNVNVTLIFSLDQYRRTADAFLKGMERLQASGGELRSVRSVASVFVSRIEVDVDKLIDAQIEAGADEDTVKKLKSFRGRAAVSNSKLMYKEYSEIFSGERFGGLKAKGAGTQRVLWASTGTKDPAYSDIKYITELIARDTVNTAPDKTYYAFADHGEVREAVTADRGDAQCVIDGLKELGIDVHSVCAEL